MFLSVSVRHVGAHLDGQQHDVSIQINSSDLNLGEGLCIFTSFHFPDSGLYLLNAFKSHNRPIMALDAFYFYFDLF